jgi:hypothetical protein
MFQGIHGRAAMATWRTLAAWVLLFLSAPAFGQTHVLSESPKPGDCFRYDLAMTLKGELRVNRDGKTVAIPINADARHAFVERILEAPDKCLPEKVARHYSLAKSTVTVDGNGGAQELSDDRRLIVSQRFKEQKTCYSPAGPMTRAELEVAEEHFDTLALTGVLPDKEVRTGDTWRLPNEAVQALCQFDALINHDLTAKLDEVADGFASISIGGKASGIELGALVKLTVSAKVKYEILPKHLVQLEWSQKDERDQGPASPASTVETTTMVKRTAIEQPKELSETALEGIPRGFEVPQALALVYHKDLMSRYDVAASREWRLVAQTDLHIVLRLIDKGDLIAQVALTAWNKADPGKHISADDFKQAMAAAPGWQLEEVLDAGEIPADNGRWLYRISARGQMDDVKVVQTFFLLASAQGDQVVATFTMKPGQAAKIGNRDLTLVGSIGFPKKKD